MSRRVIIVDGYNVIGALSVLRPERLEAAREALLDRLSRYAAVRGHRVIAVFDGSAEVRGGAPRHPHPGVEIVFSAAGEKADPVVVRRARDLKGQCVVVSDDHGVRRPCEHAGAVVLHCEEFDRLLARSEREPVPDRPAVQAQRHPVPAPAAAPLSDADRAAWEAFAADVDRLPAEALRKGNASLPAEPPPPVPAAAPAAAMPVAVPVPAPAPSPVPPDPLDPWSVPDDVVAAKDADEAPVRRGDRGPSRDARRRRNILDDL